MKTKSAKAKGRSLIKKLKSRLLEAFPILEEDDLKVTSSGETGEDLQLSPYAREMLPYQFEGKKHKAFSIYTHYDQAAEHGKYEPVLVIEADRREPLVVISLDEFINLIKG